jgi:deoxyadenosine/deoxycytidine kinase
MHKTEQVLIPEGIRKGYYIDIDFGQLKERISSFVRELEDIINGGVESVYRKNALAAYDQFGKNKARSTLKILDRFESTLVRSMACISDYFTLD